MESGHGWVPSILLAPLPTSLVGQVQFYSDGVHTVLAPAGWTCSIVAGSSSAAGLAVYPSGTPSPPVGYPTPAGAEGVFAIFTNTGNSFGVGLVCTYFTVADWQKHEASCGNPPPAGQKFSMATPDVASVTDPAGVAGTLSGSGGAPRRHRLGHLSADPTRRELRKLAQRGRRVVLAGELEPLSGHPLGLLRPRIPVAVELSPVERRLDVGGPSGPTTPSDVACTPCGLS